MPGVACLSYNFPSGSKNNGKLYVSKFTILDTGHFKVLGCHAHHPHYTRCRFNPEHSKHIELLVLPLDDADKLVAIPKPIIFQRASGREIKDIATEFYNTYGNVAGSVDIGMVKNGTWELVISGRGGKIVKEEDAGGLVLSDSPLSDAEGEESEDDMEPLPSVTGQDSSDDEPPTPKPPVSPS